MQRFGLDQWSSWRREGFDWLPFVRVERGASLPRVWSQLVDGPATVLLESAQSGRYTYVCDRPARVLIGRADETEFWSADCTTRLHRQRGQPLEVLAGVLSSRRTPKMDDVPAMTGGLMGVFGYDLVRTWERLPMRARRDLPLPLFAMIETQEMFVFDHVDDSLFMIVWRAVGPDEPPLSELWEQSNAATAAMWRRWSAAFESLPGLSAANRNLMDRSETHSLTPEDFKAAARRTLEYIAAGDTYQVNLSLRTSQPVAASAEVIYEALRRVNPSPYMGLLRMPEFALVCGSPELLVRLVDGVVSSRPIAGTRPRGDAVRQDSHMSAELLASGKERAEHLMLVDLIRNDIGRVAEYGTVNVSEFMGLEHYSHVMHIVSQVEGRLAAGKTWVHVFKSMFPGGTITGCPKIRTMEIIDELEPVGRGFYTGALGWISYAGEMELNIVIRSMLVHKGIAHVQAGAGIVADSQPDRELDEALRKAQALWVALEQTTTSRERT